jgi:hypothetical protein
MKVFRIKNPDNTGCWDSKNPNDGAQIPISGETETDNGQEQIYQYHQ